MTSHQLLHMLGIFLLGGGACTLLQTHAPLQEPFKRVAITVVGLMTIAYMAMVANLI